MNIKKILAITIIALALFSCLGAVSAGWFDFLGGDKHLIAEDSQVTVPGNYTVDDKGILASSDTINMTFSVFKNSDDKFETKFFNAVKSDGKSAGYENITNKTVNGYTIHEFAANPKNLKNLTAETQVEGSDEAWITFPPEIAAPFDNPVDHFRSVTYLKDGKEVKLVIFTGNATVDLYSSEINGIIDSIAPVENK
ncbi:hypothetical protein [uncultured Methanobrevibacter sp.]|uniref:hypothetical protein n=1 Tax=uncultured Methanobrevibacter sp. TaxID=253161 RepID=UPI0025F3546B|nr:hypothetical protein [uncultured Methanobrevibacter sp.]